MCEHQLYLEIMIKIHKSQIHRFAVWASLELILKCVELMKTDMNSQHMSSCDFFSFELLRIFAIRWEIVWDSSETCALFFMKAYNIAQKIQ